MNDEADNSGFSLPDRIKPPAKTGRPSIYSAELGAEICRRIARGNSVRAIARMDDMPSLETIYDWVNSSRSFAEEFFRARVQSADAVVDQCFAIADDSSNDTRTIHTRGGDTIEHADREWIDRSKLRVGFRQWFASRLNPARYGEKTQVEHSGSIELKLGLRLDDALRYRDTFMTPQVIDGVTTPAAIEDESA